jgi:hypothetical protein
MSEISLDFSFPLREILYSMSMFLKNEIFIQMIMFV